MLIATIINGNFIRSSITNTGYRKPSHAKFQPNVEVFCAGIWQALGEAIGDEELEKLIKSMQRNYEDYRDYATHYIDKCNIELIKTPFEKRKSKLKSIAKRMVKKPEAYYHMEDDLKYWARHYNTSIYELRLPNLEYPAVIEW